MAVIIGVDPHKATHTAVAIDHLESEVGRVRVRATRRRVPQRPRRRVAARADPVLRHELSELVVAGRGDEDLGGAVLRGGGRQPAAAKRHWRQRGR